MNITELARILKITPQELRDDLPRLGFDIGQKAIKINGQVAQKIIREWPRLKNELSRLKESQTVKPAETAAAAGEKTAFAVPALITVREFSRLAGVPVNKVLTVLMKNGVFASLNERIDYDTAWLIGSELGLEVTRQNEQDEAGAAKKENELAVALAGESDEHLAARPPVIVVMGHVDHGKTKLLDAIRRTNVVDTEAGGITQHVGAYQVIRKNKTMTFIDTPGHEAFTAMRSRGAKVADIAILVVAADDGVKPQTVEAYRIIEAAKIPFVVAINKIDKPEANVDKTKQELSSQLNIRPEDWGGQTICVPISAKANRGIDELLDNILLVADMEAKNMRANPDAPAIGTTVESHVDKGAGPVATILVQNGTLRIGDCLCRQGQAIGKVRSLKDYRGESLTAALPSMPVKIFGLKALPEVGDLVLVGEGEKVKTRKLYCSTDRNGQTVALTEDETVVKIPVIIKSDVLGSAEAIEESLEKINLEKVKVEVISKGLGNITDGDLKKAEATQAAILGFNVKVPPSLEDIIREKKIKVKTYQIIYNLIADVKSELEALVAPEIQRVEIGQAKVLAVFRTDKNNQIVGAKITSGRSETGASAEVWRNEKMLASGKITKLQSAKQDVTAVETNQECGLQFEGKGVILAGDILKFFKEEKIYTK